MLWPRVFYCLVWPTQKKNLNSLDICVEPTLAKKDQKLIQSIDDNDLETVNASFAAGASANCPSARLNEATRKYTIPQEYDVPLYHAIKPGVEPEILKSVIAAGAVINSNVPKDQADVIEDRYFGFYTGVIGGDHEAQKSVNPNLGDDRDSID